MKSFNVAVVGATGAVGRKMLEILIERAFPIETLYPLASHRSQGKTIEIDTKRLRVEDVAQFDFSQVDFALFSAGATVSAQYAPIAAQAGAIVIDNTSHFRLAEDVPLIVPEVNAEALKGYARRNIIANPNCSTIQMVVALKPIYDAVGIERINVATYQAVSGSGQSAIVELSEQTQTLMQDQPVTPQVYPKQIAFNILPHIDVFQDNGYTKEEMKMVWETQKIFEDPHILVNPTTARVPVFYGHSEALHLETKEPISVKEATERLKKAPGIRVIDERQDGGYATPALEADGSDEVFVSRIRRDISHPCGLNLWVVSDNIRKGAALNSVQIAQTLINQQLI